MAQRRLPGSGKGRTECNAGASPSGGTRAMLEQGPPDKECRIGSRGSRPSAEGAVWEDLSPGRRERLR
jgi:hypothetical protein